MMPVPEYHLHLDPADLRWLRNHPGTRRCFPATLQVGTDHWPAWIGYRGRYSRLFPKASYDLWFPPSAPFHGHRQLHLNAAYRDPSLLRGRLALEVFADLGVPAPQAWHAWVTLNGKPQGLYTAVESVNGDWLRRRGLPDGSIYYGVGGEGHFGLINPRTGKPKRHLALGYEKCHPDDDDFSDLVDLIHRIALPEDREFEATIDAVVDADSVLRWLVGVVFISHTDGFVHNYAIFRSDDGRWQISPWDCDGTWGRTPSGHRLPADYLPLADGGGNYLATRLLRAPRWRRRYVDLWEEALAGPLAADRIAARLHALYAAIRPYALADPRKRYRNSTFQREPARIRRYTVERTAFVRRQLAALQAVGNR